MLANSNLNPNPGDFKFEFKPSQNTDTAPSSAWAALLSALRPARGGVMWRNGKSDVKNELCLPDLEHVGTRLRMEGVEVRECGVGVDNWIICSN